MFSCKDKQIFLNYLIIIDGNCASSKVSVVFISPFSTKIYAKMLMYCSRERRELGGMV
jgi:hypothetical protein